MRVETDRRPACALTVAKRRRKEPRRESRQVLLGLRVQTDLTVTARIPGTDTILRVFARTPVIRAVLLRWLRLCRRGFLRLANGRTREAAELGKLELEVDVVQVVDEKAAESRGGPLRDGSAAREHRQSLLVLI